MDLFTSVNGLPFHNKETRIGRVHKMYGLFKVVTDSSVSHRNQVMNTGGTGMILEYKHRYWIIISYILGYKHTYIG